MGGIPSGARAPRGPAGGDVEVRSSRNDRGAAGPRLQDLRRRNVHRWRGGGLGLWRGRRGIGRDRVNRERARNGDREREQPGGRRLRGGCARYRRDAPRLRIRVGRMHVRALARSGDRRSAIPVRRRAAAGPGAGSGADPELRAAARRDSSSHPVDRRIPTAGCRCARRRWHPAGSSRRPRRAMSARQRRRAPRRASSSAAHRASCQYRCESVRPISGAVE